MHICSIDSMVHPVLKDGLIEDGYFHLAVHVDMKEATLSGDPKGFINKTISEHLAGCCATTGLPLKERCWQVTFSSFAQNNFNYPEGFVT